MKVRGWSNVPGWGHQPRNACDLQKMEMERKWILPQSLQDHAALLLIILL